MLGNRVRTALLAFLVLLSGLTTMALTAAPASAAAACTSGVSVYGVLPDGRLSYTAIDPDTGDITHVVVSSKTLGFTAKALATLNFNTLLVTSTAGVLYRVDVVTNSGSLTFDDPIDVQHGWTHTLLSYDGHGHLYGTTAGGSLLQYLVSAPKPGVNQIGQRREIGSGGFSLKTLTTAGDDRLLATASDGQLISYAVSPTGTTYTRAQLDDAGWQSFENLVSPGGGLYYGKNPDGAMYWYEDDDPADGSGTDIAYHLNDPVASRGWTQSLLSADPAGCTSTPPVKPLRSKIAALATGEVGTTEASCDKYNDGCNHGANDWCAMFATWTWSAAGVANVPRGTWVARGLGAWGVDHGLFKSRTGSAHGSPKIGDWAIYGPPDGSTGGHVDVITAVHPDGTLTVVGGNVSNKVTRRVIDPGTARSGVQDQLISGYVSPPGA
ncbi:tachylectin-related carbohydrate-binding protein [Amycolatopsis sp. PS_44_ISF1]|uniref:tachylectin-related carbohydrate-binding protein n=1 Tax=Amycolatopsis sp. PS_44_ISF1 TaxID=2974917 RepID=UPI0028DF0692|nr:tachylectin-related carbohydrate-binding protein [Amycolatopsis sp. PS_44_ISF1]MDT8914505.1 tachylectin-related carbohydrate-binding protein [Amycolatopsis sp. PS_44_ISF1]